MQNEANFESYRDERERRRLEWRERNADPLFGLPDDDYGPVLVYWNFSKAPFSHARSSAVIVSTLGSPSQIHRELFLRLESKIPDLQDLVPHLLVSEAKPERDIECYGETNPEKAAIAFAPEYIFKVELFASDPVLWKVHSHHPIDQDVYITVEGKDEVVTRAYLSM